MYILRRSIISIGAARGHGFVERGSPRLSQGWTGISPVSLFTSYFLLSYSFLLQPSCKLIPPHLKMNVAYFIP